MDQRVHARGRDRR